MITLIRLLLLLLLLIALLKVVRWIADFRNSLNDHFALGEECRSLRPPRSAGQSRSGVPELRNRIGTR